MLDDQQKMFNERFCAVSRDETIVLGESIKRAVFALEEVVDQIHRVAMKNWENWPDFQSTKNLKREIQLISEWHQEIQKRASPVKTIDRSKGESLQ